MLSALRTVLPLMALLVALCLCSVSCAAKKATESAPGGLAAEYDASAPPMPAAAPEGRQQASDALAMAKASTVETSLSDTGGAPEQSSVAAMVESAKIIYTGSVALEVEDIASAERAFRTLVKENGGYVSTSNLTYAEGSATGGTITARVPSENYRDTFDKLSGGELGLLITAHEETTDVTEQWVDTEARIRVLTEQRDELRKLLERHGGLQEIFEIEKQIMEVQTQIEQAQGRLNVLRNQVQLSTITVELRLRREDSDLLRAERESERWSPGRVYDRAVAGLVRAWQGIANVAIYLAIYIPCWGPFALLIWWAYRRSRRAIISSSAARQAELEASRRAWEAYRGAPRGDGPEAGDAEAGPETDEPS